MELGEKILLARQEAGLSQRQLCGEEITRNMLSQIEHGTARPSMDTLRYLAGQLGKPMSYFLEEDAVVSPNQKRMEQAREAFARGEHSGVLELLRQYSAPDPVFDWERKYLTVLSGIAGAEQALGQGKPLYARRLLENGEAAAEEFPELERKRLLLLGTIPGTDLPAVVSRLPELDEELLLRAEAALNQGNPERAAALLDAAEYREAPRWNLLRGQTLFRQNRYAPAAACMEKAEETYPEHCWPMLEICFRELGDYQKAYLYACKQR